MGMADFPIVVAASVDMLMVAVAVPFAGTFTITGSNTVTPSGVGGLASCNSTVPAKPFWLVRVSLALPLFPCVNVSGEALIVKPDELTVNGSCRVCTNEPLVAVRFIV